jgi:hypothetical protein
MSRIIGNLKRTSDQIKSTSVNFYNHVNRYPMEAIETVLAALLSIFGVLALIPPEWLGQSNTVYGLYLLRAAFGITWLLPALPIIYWRIRLSIHEYIYVYQNKRRIRLFWIAITWMYFCILSLITRPVFPPHWLIYSALALISGVCYVRLYK